MIQLPDLPPNSLEGQVVLVTGAYGGLGEAAAKAAAEAGATVVLLGKKVPKLNRVYDALKKIGPEPAMYPLDMRGADPADYEAMADKIAAELGGLNGIVHCAADFSGLRPGCFTAVLNHPYSITINRPFALRDGRKKRGNQNASR